MKISRTMLMGAGLAIFAVTVWLYWPGVQGAYLLGDDTEYLQQAERWHGLTWNAVKWAFTCTDSYYHPVVRVSHVLDYQLWGENAAGPLAVNIVVHALNAALVFGLLWTLLGAASLADMERFLAALWVALIFAIHPLQVESVAWISGRTQLLCTTFCLISLWAYAANGSRWLVWGGYGLALLCKPMAVSLPFVMLALDYYPLRRIATLGWGRVLREKVVWMALAAGMALAAILTKSPVGQHVRLAEVPLAQRVLVMFESLMFYPWKLVWPGRLSPYYPLRLGLSLTQWPVLASVLGSLLITAVVVLKRQRAPLLISAWIAYLVLILPVSGPVLTVWQAVAARYAYAAIIPLAVIVGGALVWVSRRSTKPVCLVLVGGLAIPLCAFGWRTRTQLPVWRNDESEWRAVLAEFPDLPMANRLLAAVLVAQGRAAEALEFARRDVALNPHQSFAHYYLGHALLQAGQPGEAVGEFEQALQLNPAYVEAHYNLALALEKLGRTPEAIAQDEQALKLLPDFAPAREALARLQGHP
jgi:hypothetical protein